MRRRRQKLFAVLPTILTLGNAACGFGAITFAAKVGPDTAGGDELVVASLLIFLAMLFDALDGSAARLTSQTSEFGAQLDSLCDAISFGLAPAFLMLQFISPTHHLNLFQDLLEGAQVTLFEYPRKLLWVIGALYVVCALLRLARFNVETEEDDTHDSFSGLPTPAAAGTIASFPIALRGLAQFAADSESALYWLSRNAITGIAMLMPLITLAVAMLMVSKLRYIHVFNQLLKSSRSRSQVLQIVFSIAMIFLVKELALPVLFCSFAFASPIKAGWNDYIMTHIRRSPPRSEGVENQPVAPSAGEAQGVGPEEG